MNSVEKLISFLIYIRKKKMIARLIFFCFTLFVLLSLQVKESISEDSRAPARNNVQTFNIDPEPLKGSRTISPID